MRQRCKLSKPLRILLTALLVLAVSVLVARSESVPVCFGLFLCLAITTPLYFARLAWRDWQAWRSLQSVEAERTKRQRAQGRSGS